MKRTYGNVVNGNLTLARNQARRYTQVALRDWAMDLDNCGYPYELANAYAEFLKNKGSFQTYCDLLNKNNCV